jgi:hypothetical protein
MGVGHVDGAGPEPDALGRSRDPGEEGDRRRDASRSSCSDCRQSFSNGWIGIVKKPSFIAAGSSKAIVVKSNGASFKPSRQAPKVGCPEIIGR